MHRFINRVMDLFRFLINSHDRKNKMENLRYLEDVSTLKLNDDLCIGCGLCTQVCPHGVFELEATQVTIVDQNACMECGACVHNCPVDAIEVNPGVG